MPGFPQRGKIQFRRQRVAVDHEHRIGNQLRFDVFQGAAGAEGRGLAGEDDVEFVGGPRGEVSFQHVGQVAGGEQDPDDAVALEPVQLPFEERPAGDGHQALGPVGELRGNPRAFAAQ